MKPKFLSLSALALLLTGPCYGAFLLYDRTPAPVQARDIFNLNQNKTNFQIPADADIQKAQDLSQKLILIANPQLDHTSGINLKLFGENRVVNQYNYKGDTATADIEFAYDITFTFIANDNRYCYINKKFYQQGDVMPDGGRISTIETNQVLVIKNNISEWIPVKAKASPTDDPEQKDSKS